MRRAGAGVALACGLVLALAAVGPAVAVVPSDPISRIAGTGSTGNSGDNASALLAQLNAPQGITVDAQGRLYIADGGNGSVRRVDPDGIIRTIASGFGEPADVAVDAQGRVLVAGASANIVFQIAPGGGVTPFAGTGTAASGGDGASAVLAQVNEPRGVAVDAAGNVYIAESGGDRIRRVGLDGVIQTIAGTGSPGFAGDGGLATSAQLFGPRDVVVAPDGSIVVVDSANERVRRIGTDGVIRTIAGSGGSSGSACPSAPADAGATPLDFAQRAAVDGAGNVYLASQGCVTKIAGGLIQRIAGNGGSTGDSGDGGQAAQALVQPSGVAVDPAGSLLISAGADNKVRRVLNVAPTAAFTAASPAPLTVDTDASGSSSGQAGEALSAIAWDFGDGTGATGATARHVYAAAGTYTVTLTVRDDSGAAASTSRAVAVAAPPPPPPRIVVTKPPSVAGAYRGGRLRASLVVTGTASGAGRVPVTLTRRSGPRATGLATTATLELVVRRAGAFTARLALPRDLAPGTYALRIGGIPVAGRAGTVTVARPPVGLVRRAFVSSVQNGPAARAFPSRTRRLFCTFDFAVLPLRGAGRVITTQWRVPGATLGRVTKARSARVTGVAARSGGVLPSGRYTCTLRVGDTAVSSVRARIRS